MKKSLRILVLSLCALVCGAAYADEGDTWSICGEINSWDNTDTTYDFTYSGDGVYTLSVETFKGAFKIIKDHTWSTELGGNGEAVVIGEEYTLGSDGNITLTNSATLTNATFTLTITDDGATLLVTAESYTEVTENVYYLAGDVNSWSTSASPFESTSEEDVYTLALESLSGTFKILANQSWGYSWGSNGSTFTLCEEYTLTGGSNPGNITVDATYTNVTLTLTIADDAYTLLMTETSADDTDGIAAISFETIDVNAPVYNIAGQRVSPDAKGVLIQGGKKSVNK